MKSYHEGVMLWRKLVAVTSIATLLALGAAGVPAQQVVSSGAYAISVPRTWPVVKASPGACERLNLSGLVVGDVVSLERCFPTASVGMFSEFGDGGPPNFPVVASSTSLSVVHGVHVTTVEGVPDPSGATQVVAFLNGWDNWLLFLLRTNVTRGLQEARGSSQRCGRFLSTGPWCSRRPRSPLTAPGCAMTKA